MVRLKYATPIMPGIYSEPVEKKRLQAKRDENQFRSFDLLKLANDNAPKCYSIAKSGGAKTSISRKNDSLAKASMKIFRKARPATVKVRTWTLIIFFYFYKVY